MREISLRMNSRTLIAIVVIVISATWLITAKGNSAQTPASRWGAVADSNGGVWVYDSQNKSEPTPTLTKDRYPKAVPTPAPIRWTFITNPKGEVLACDSISGDCQLANVK
jgi:hypothetical protein